MNKVLINFSFFKKIFYDRKWSIVTYSLIVVLYAALIITVFPSIKKSGAEFEKIMEIYPPAFKEAFGINVSSFNTIEGFLSVEYFSAMWIFIISILIFSLGSCIVAGEIDKGTSEFAFTLPLRRIKIVLSKFLSSYLITLIIIVVTLGSVILGMYTINEKPYFKGFLTFFVIGAVLSFFLLAFTTAVSTILSSKGRVYGVCGGFLILSYLLHVLNGIHEKAGDFYFLSFFKYYGLPEKILLTGDIAAKNIAVFLFAGLILLIFSLIITEKRDL